MFQRERGGLVVKVTLTSCDQQWQYGCCTYSKGGKTLMSLNADS